MRTVGCGSETYLYLNGIWSSKEIELHRNVTLMPATAEFHYKKVRDRMEMTSNVHSVQLVQLDILKAFMFFCDRYHLRWYMIGGSLIGVLRHKGFIPWDDDIDVGMPRPDYDKFVALQKELPKDFSLICHATDKKWQFNFSQLVDCESEIIVHMNEQPRHCKIWIDVFPIDGLPAGTFARWWHIKKIMMYRYLIQIPNIRSQVDTHKVGRPWYEKAVIKLLHILPLGRLVDVDKMLKRMACLLRSYSYETSAWAGNMLGKYREREAMPKEWWGDPVLLPFENVMVNCPTDSNNIERKLYGDYMKWPEMKNRVSHDIEIIKLRNEQ